MSNHPVSITFSTAYFYIDQIIMKLKYIFFFFFLAFLHMTVQARQDRSVEVDDASIDMRVYPAKGDVLLLGFPCDEGKSTAEEKTSMSLAEDGIEVWMTDLLSSYMLPDLPSSLAEIPAEAIVKIIDEAMKTGKTVYLIASGSDTELVLRGASQWEAKHNKSLAGAVLLFPRLYEDAPEPGVEPDYISAVGKTRLPLMILEGARTPNQWSVNKLVRALQKGGSSVYAKLIPSVRGYFYSRQDANRSEEVVTSQLAGLIKVSLYYLERAKSND